MEIKQFTLANLATVDFEDGNVPPLNWTLNNPDNDDTWLIYSTSGYGVGAKSTKFDFYSYASIGKIDELVTPIVTGYLATDSLLFDYAYAEYSATYVDSFRVQMSLDGGTTFPVSLFYAWGIALLHRQRRAHLFRLPHNGKRILSWRAGYWSKCYFEIQSN